MTRRRDEPATDMFEDAVLESIARLKPEIDDEELQRVVTETAKQMAESVVGSLHEATPAMLIDYAALRAGFEIRLRDPWGPAFDGLQALIVTARESGERFVALHGEEAAAERPDGDLPFNALARLHARALTVAEEVFALLRAGFAGGAMARWRTLHEIAVVMAFLAEKGHELAERYLLHDAVASWRGVLDYQLFADRLGDAPFTDEEVAQMRAERDALVDRFGVPYGEEWGWAAEAVGKPRPTFRDIENAADLAHWRPYGRRASQNVHAGPRALFDVMGLDDESDILLAGASNLGLADPGANAAFSLALATVELLATRAGVEDMVSMQVVMRLKDEVAEAFVRASEELDHRVEAERRRKRRRGYRRSKQSSTKPHAPSSRPRGA